MSPLSTLKITNVHVGYTPGVDILRGMNLDTEGSGITAVIGPNGAGKSTLLKTIYGFLRPHTGTVMVNDENITSYEPHKIKARGLSYIAQGINTFPQLTVEENLRMGAWTIRGNRERVQTQMESIYELFPALRLKRRNKANELSGGQAKMLSIAKELMTEPSMVLLDEPTAGLSPALSEEVYGFILNTRKALGCSMVLVDHNIEEAVAISDYVYLLNLGRVKEQGLSSEFDMPRVRRLIQECLTG
jgi:ABC-type branched-subunit amino acid transport system ATPase component